MIAHCASFFSPDEAPVSRVTQHRMALLTAMIKTLMAALFVLVALALPGQTATFSMKRGLNL
ncbi:hypothetical protein EN969_18750, partial [Mesorhizobium sp. M7A.F.Ca.CA.003.01.2.1]